jgi:alpha-tubulin suppressor-like RCC1 family protein
VRVSGAGLTAQTFDVRFVVEPEKTPTMQMVSAGGSHTVALCENGIVWAWGSNSFGQLGDGTTTDRLMPIQVQGISSAIDIATGRNHSVALLSDGTVWTWGNNTNGILGDGTTTNRLTPVQVQGLSNIISITSGINFGDEVVSGLGLCHTVALRYDGSVWAWGNNIFGQLGDGTGTSHSIPIQVQEINNIVAISAGSGHTVALSNNGSVWAWGDNRYGQLGNGSTIPRSTPTPVGNPINASMLGGVISVSAGGSSTIALQNSSYVSAWGANDSGQLGDTTTTDQLSPVQVATWLNALEVIAIASGSNYSVALHYDGTVWAWGNNSVGTLGDGTLVNQSSPVQVRGLNNITAISAGYNHTVVIRSDGTVWAWGANDAGQLGDGTTANRMIPIQVRWS